jgi:hypothetical protein
MLCALEEGIIVIKKKSIFFANNIFNEIATKVKNENEN